MNWDCGDSNRHFYSIFLESNLIWLEILHVNMFSKQFIFEFSDEFNTMVDRNNEAFVERGVLFPYLVSCHFKV